MIDRPPSAELRDNQTDQDSLPPYDELDAILERFIEGEQSQAEIVAAGLRRRHRAPGGAAGAAERIQAPPVGAGPARDHARVRPRTALSDHFRLALTGVGNRIRARALRPSYLQPQKRPAITRRLLCVAAMSRDADSVMARERHHLAQRGRRMRPLGVGQVRVVRVVQRQHLAGLVGQAFWSSAR